MKKILSLFLVVFMLLPMFAVVPVSAAEAAVAGDAKSFADPVNAGKDKYYPTKTLQTVDFTKIKSDAELAAAGVTYLDASASDSFGVSYVDDGMYYYSSSDVGYVLSDVKLNAQTSYIVDFTIRVNPEVHILEASAAFTDKTTINGDYGTVIDKAGAFKLRLKQSNNTVLNLDNGKYYSDAECTTLIGEGKNPGTDAQTAAYTNQADVRVKMLFVGGTWKYAELSVAGETYYIYYDNASTAHTGYFGFRGVGNTKVVLKNLTISECAKDATDSATVVNDGNIYRVAAGTTIDTAVYNKSAVAVDADGAFYYATDKITAAAGKTYTIVGQSTDLFIAPVYAGSTKYYTKKVLQTVDFTKIKNEADLQSAGMKYFDVTAGDGYGLSYSERGLRYHTDTNIGYLLSNVKMSSGSSYIADFTVSVDPSAHILVASAAFPDRNSMDSSVGASKGTVDGKSFKLRMKSDNKLTLDGATYYSDSACTASIGANPDASAMEAAIANKADVRVRLLFTGGSLQYGELTVEGKTYYIKMNSAKSGQTGYFGFTGFGSVEVLLKNLTISECEANPSAHAFVKSGDKVYRVGVGQTLNAADYTEGGKTTVVFGSDGEYSATVTTKSGKSYTVKALDDVTVKTAGASARLKTDSGLRFASAISCEDIALLEELKTGGVIKSYSYGTIITLAKYAKALDNNVTHATLDAFAKDNGINNSYVDVEASDWYAQTGDTYYFVGSIVKIKPENYNREYASAGYLTVTLADGSERTFYADYEPVNARSVSYVAACAYYDKSVSYNETQIAILTAFIGDRKYYPLVVDGASEYTVVYDADDAEAKALATEFVDAFAEAGINLPLKADTASVSGKGLYIGATSHALSKASTAYYINAQIACDASGNIAITGNLKVGASELLDKVYDLKAGLTKTLLLDETLMGFYTDDGFGNAPKYTGGGTVELKYSFELSKSYYLLVHGATVTDYNNYLNTLTAAGYECYHSTEANGNKFSTYTDGYNILTLSHIAYYDPATGADGIYKTPSNGNVSYMTIAIDCVENSALPEMSAEIKDITTEQMTTVGTGCGYVLRLADGRFVVFDGGLYSATSTLYNIICEQNVLDGKPVIAAWFLTHGHSDHIGTIFGFLDSYSDKVEIESFVHNLPAYEQYKDKNTAEGANNTEDDALYERSLKYYNDIAKKYPNADIIVARAGQRFKYGDIDIDVLFSCENLYKKQMLDTNGSSVIYSITGKSGRMLVLGDLVDPEGAVLNAVYGSSLKCDLVQVAHHGLNNGNTEMYNSMNADYAIWANNKSGITGYGNASWRNFFDHTSVFSNLIPDASKPAIILTENMTKADMVALNVDLSGYVSAVSK